MKIFLWLLCGALVLTSVSCTDENRIAAAYKGDEELAEGGSVPVLVNQNYPNPFNPSTVITFGVSRPMHVSLKAYTEDWQEVSVMVDEELAAGYYARVFNASYLPSGDYYYVLEGMGYTQIRKMKLVK
jgi:hypothetical protein